MFLGLKWYFWLAIIVVIIPLKILFIKWWNKREKNNNDWSDKND